MVQPARAAGGRRCTSQASGSSCRSPAQRRRGDLPRAVRPAAGAEPTRASSGRSACLRPAPRPGGRRSPSTRASNGAVLGSATRTVKRRAVTAARPTPAPTAPTPTGPVATVPPPPAGSQVPIAPLGRQRQRRGRRRQGRRASRPSCTCWAPAWCHRRRHPVAALPAAPRARWSPPSGIPRPRVPAVDPNQHGRPPSLGYPRMPASPTPPTAVFPTVQPPRSTPPGVDPWANSDPGTRSR